MKRFLLSFAALMAAVMIMLPASASAADATAPPVAAAATVEKAAPAALTATVIEQVARSSYILYSAYDGQILAVTGVEPSTASACLAGKGKSKGGGGKKCVERASLYRT